MPKPATTQREVMTRKPGCKRRSVCIHNHSIVPRPANCSIHSHLHLPPTRTLAHSRWFRRLPVPLAARPAHWSLAARQIVPAVARARP